MIANVCVMCESVCVFLMNIALHATHKTNDPNGGKQRELLIFVAMGPAFSSLFFFANVMTQTLRLHFHVFCM